MHAGNAATLLLSVAFHWLLLSPLVACYDPCQFKSPCPGKTGATWYYCTEGKAVGGCKLTPFNAIDCKGTQCTFNPPPCPPTPLPSPPVYPPPSPVAVASADAPYSLQLVPSFESYCRGPVVDVYGNDISQRFPACADADIAPAPVVDKQFCMETCSSGILVLGHSTGSFDFRRGAVYLKVQILVDWDVIAVVADTLIPNSKLVECVGELDQRPEVCSQVPYVEWDFTMYNLGGCSRSCTLEPVNLPANAGAYIFAYASLPEFTPTDWFVNSLTVTVK